MVGLMRMLEWLVCGGCWSGCVEEDVGVIGLMRMLEWLV